MQHHPIIVVGAGIVGLSCGYYLARRGKPVVVLAREPVGETASSGNAGLLSLGHAPLTKPGASMRGIRWMFDRRSPLYIKPRLNAELVSWLWTFHRHCTASWLDRCLVSLADMGWKSIALFEQMISDEGIDSDYRRDGWLDVSLDPANLDVAEAEAKSIERFGFRYERMDGEQLRRRDSVFRDEVAGAIHYVDSAHLNPRDFMEGLERACARAGATLRGDVTVQGLCREPGGRVTGVDLRGGERIEADRVVLAGGIWSEELGRTIGVHVPMQAARGYHLQLDDVPALPSTGLVLHETFVAVTPMRQQLRLAGTLEIGPIGRPWMRERLDMLTIGAKRYLHGLDKARVVGEWAGYRPCTADGMPVLGEVPGVPGLVVATGHAMMGMNLGPITGKVAAEIACGETPSIDLTLLRPDRF